MMHLRIQRPNVPIMDSRSTYPRVYPPYTSMCASYHSTDLSRDRWSTTATTAPRNPLSRFNLFPDIESPLRGRQPPLSSSHEGRATYRAEIPRSQPLPSSSQPSTSSGGKWTANDLENYFNQVRISSAPCTRDVLAKAAENMSTLRSMHPPQGNGLVDGKGRVEGKTVDHEDGYVRGKGFEDGSCGLNSPVSPTDTEESISSSGGETCSLGLGGVPERNQIVLEKVMMGLDKRTTIMIKNVPNKYTQVQSSAFRSPLFCVASERC